MAEAIGEALPEKTPNRVSGGTYQVQVSRRAMACQFEVSFNAGQYENDTEAALEALDLVDALDDQMSVFRQHSEISRINRTAAAATVANDQTTSRDFAPRNAVLDSCSSPCSAGISSSPSNANRRFSAE